MTNQHGPKPMRRYAVFLDDATAEYYKALGSGNRSEGMRRAARGETATAPVKPEPVTAPVKPQ